MHADVCLTWQMSNVSAYAVLEMCNIMTLPTLQVNIDSNADPMMTYSSAHEMQLCSATSAAHILQLSGVSMTHSQSYSFLHVTGLRLC